MNEKLNRKLIEGLNEAFNCEIATSIRYLLQGSAIRGRANQPLREMYREEVADEMGHAQYLADTIVRLGGTPSVNPNLSAPPQDVDQMIEQDIEAELSDVAHYVELADLADEANEIELRMRLEDLAADESHHADKLRRLRE